MLKPLIATRDPGIAAEIVHAAGSSGLTRLWDPLRVMLEHTPETRMSGVGRVALLSLAQSAVSHGMLATDRLAVEMPIAAALKCLRDGNSLLSVLPSEQLAAPAAIDACGWSGEEAARPLLLYNLESGGPSQKIAAAKALHRIYGLSCYDEVPEASRPDEPPTSRKVKRLSQQRSVWEEAIRQFDTTPRSSSRLRHGIPWSPLSALRHLERPDAAFGERLIAAWEHALVNRTAIPFYPSVFVRRQREALARLR
jgi:hypothetical protein